MSCCGGSNLNRQGVTQTGGILSSSAPLSLAPLKRGSTCTTQRGLSTVVCPQYQFCEVCYDAASATFFLIPGKQYGSEGFKLIQGAPFCINVCTFEDRSKGPFVEGDTEQNDFIYDWVFQRFGDMRYQYGRVDGEMQSASAFFPDGTPSDRITICFESTGRPVFAIGYQGTITIKREVAEVVQTYGPFTGISPQLWYNGEILDSFLYSDDRDAVCYYLKTDETNIFARFQRDNFSVEYIVGSGLPVAMKLLTLASSTVQYMTLKALPAQGATLGYEIVSVPYPPVFSAQEHLAFGASCVSGEYVLTAIETTAGDHVGFSATCYGVVYSDGVVPLPEYTDPTSFDATCLTADYTLVVVSAGSHTDPTSFDATCLTADYTS